MLCRFVVCARQIYSSPFFLEEPGRGSLEAVPHERRRPRELTAMAEALIYDSDYAFRAITSSKVPEANENS